MRGAVKRSRTDRAVPGRVFLAPVRIAPRLRSCDPTLQESPMNDLELGRHYLAEAIKGFRALKTQGERAIAQVSDEQLVATIDAEANSIAVLMKHLAGNMRSRWTDFL